MIYVTTYHSPIGNITLSAEGQSLIGAWFEGQKYYMAGIYLDVTADKRRDKCDISDIYIGSDIIDKNNKRVSEIITDSDYPVLSQTSEWLGRYFNSECPNPLEIPMSSRGTQFQQRVWKYLCRIPYSCTTSYGAIAKALAKDMGVERMSAQAVGGAVSRNPISIIIPCHRVIGANKALTGNTGGQPHLVGYAGGLNKKLWLLKHEGCCAVSSTLSN